MKNLNINSNENFMKLAFDKAYEHLGSTRENPSVGCVVVKNNTVISTGKTSKNGRPHAEFNALNKKKINFKGSSVYITLEPCVHYGLTSPCIKIIKKKGVKKVFYSMLDPDQRTFGKAEYLLKKSNIKVNVGLLRSKSINFYKSYILSKNINSLPYTDIKIALSKDYFSVNKKNKWITNKFSRKQGQFLRSRYDCILSTYKSVNNDNSMLNCRVAGLSKFSPSRAIIDRDLKIKKNLKLIKSSKRIPTFIITNSTNKNKENFLKSKKIKIIKFPSKLTFLSYKEILMELKKRGFSRILCESGSHTASALIKEHLVNNLYVFLSQKKLGKSGKNSFKKHIKDLKISERKLVNLNLFGDKLYKLGLK